MNPSTRPLIIATVVGTVLQVLMVVLGHRNPGIKNIFAIGGMGISLLAGILYSAIATDTTTRASVVGGVITGGLCAFLGILVSVLFKDVPASLLALGTISSAMTGALGGWLGRLFAGARV